MKSPTYILDVRKFEDNIIRLRNAFKKYYGNYHIGYSYKTNDLPVICKEVLKLGEYAEVVSPKEYELAISLGFPHSKIIYNGVINDFKNKLNCALSGGIVNVDNYYDYIKFYKYAFQKRIKLNIGIRLNFDIGNGFSSRFGIDVGGDDFKTIVSLSSLNVINITGIHCHISSGRELKYWKVRIKKMIEFAKNFNVEYIDLGGNMYGEMDKFLANQFPESPTYEDYAKIIGTEMKKAFPNQNVTLITENGTSLVANTMDILTEVKSKNIIRGQKIFTLDCNVYDFGFLINTKIPSYEVENRSPNNFKPHVVDAKIFGNTCTEGDVILESFTGELAVGDRILFKNLGAYTNVMAPSFITEKLPISIKKLINIQIK